MKIRLAKKIMRRNTPYWIFRYLCYNRILLPGAGYKVDFKDHRITKTICLIKKGIDYGQNKITFIITLPDA